MAVIKKLDFIHLCQRLILKCINCLPKLDELIIKCLIITTDVERRFKEHQAGKGGHYTRSHKPVKIVYTEKAKDRSSALKREAEIKRWPRAQKLQLIRHAPYSAAKK